MVRWRVAAIHDRYVWLYNQQIRDYLCATFFWIGACLPPGNTAQSDRPRCSRHHSIHFIKKFLPAGALAQQVQPKAVCFIASMVVIQHKLLFLCTSGLSQFPIEWGIV